MSLPPATDHGTHLDYGLDTLFGRETKSVECHFHIMRLDDDEPPWFALRVQPPLPEDLEKAQIVVFRAEGRKISGIVRRIERLADDTLQLDVEPD
ncbi:hypothetical protein EGM97_19240 [Pseudomonas sp. AF32]|uniref:hypothetical protein n=1 Tax=Pseudomonas sp. AF32 TaxID=554390 RepID=UPI001EEE1B96|nr:hypothetical protein [Pseudomonas sp. AF32]MCG6576834.1 hypothetical protein [Pseudomonas sp. AF32]